MRHSIKATLLTLQIDKSNGECLEFSAIAVHVANCNGRNSCNCCWCRNYFSHTAQSQTGFDLYRISPGRMR
jgi:hypothetical protein